MKSHLTHFQNINKKISLAWDMNVSIRAKDLENGTDYSYTQIIKPWVLKETLQLTSSTSTILDIGCGCGYLTNAIYEKNRHSISGIDLSPKSVSYAQKRYPHIMFTWQDLHSFPAKQKYNLSLAVMVLNNAPDMDILIRIISNILKQEGYLILVLPHPLYWPLKHLNIPTFSYSEERSYMLSFSTKGRKDYPSQIQYFHRPIESYLVNAQKSGLHLVNYKEFTETVEDDTPEILGLIFKKQL